MIDAIDPKVNDTILKPSQMDVILIGVVSGKALEKDFFDHQDSEDFVGAYMGEFRGKDFNVLHKPLFGALVRASVNRWKPFPDL